MNEDEKWMKIALEEAKKAENEGEVPPNTALIVVKNGETIKSFNMKADLEVSDVIYLSKEP